MPRSKRWGLGVLVAILIALIVSVGPALYAQGRMVTTTGVVFVRGIIGSIPITVANIITTSTDGLLIQNTTAATVGVPVQYGPRIRQCGTAWKTDATTASQIDCFASEIRPESAAVATTFTYAWMKSINGGAYSDLLTLNSGGQFTATGSISATGHLGAGGAFYIFWTGRNNMTSPADGVWLLDNNAETLKVYKNMTAATESVTFRSVGAAETIAGNSSNFRITVGGTPGTTATVTFGTAWTTAPVCHAQNEVTANILKAAAAVGQVVLTGIVVAGDTITVHCEGY